jgi:hypothetical protein
MVVDAAVPEKGLVAISPKEVPCPDVLVWVFDTLLQGRHVLPVFPMLIPQVPGIDRREDEAGNHDTTYLLDSSLGRLLVLSRGSY